MQPHDLKPFTEALLGVFDALGGRPPGQAGIEVWFRTLKGFPIGDVVDSLDTWVARNGKPPTPAALADACRERGIVRREKQTEEWKAEEHNGPYTMGATPQGRAALAKIKQMVARMQRPQRGRQLQWAERVIDRYVDGDKDLSPIAFDFACEALGKSADDKLALRAMAGARKAA